MEQEEVCSRIHDAIPSTSKEQDYISSEERHYFSSWEALKQFRQDHKVSILNYMGTNSNDDVTKGRQFENIEEKQAESNIMAESFKLIVKSRGRRPGKKKLPLLRRNKRMKRERKNLSNFLC